MMFMVLIYGSDAAFDRLERDDIQRLADAHAAVHAELRKTGELRAASELETEDAWIVRSTDGSLAVTEGPFTEGKQELGGYYMIDCADSRRAIEIAGMFAEAEFAPIEVRRLGEGSTWVDALADGSA
jgi:hypothetical protein